MSFEVVSRETLRHNPLNAVTAIVERVTDGAGQSLIRKELRRPDSSSMNGTLEHWAASTEPEHWNYWRREADAYLSEPLREGLQAAGLVREVRVVATAPSRTSHRDQSSGLPRDRRQRAPLPATRGRAHAPCVVVQRSA